MMVISSWKGGREMMFFYIIQHQTRDRKKWVDEQSFSSALDAYIVIHKWGVLWPMAKHKVIERCVVGDGTYFDTVLSEHKVSKSFVCIK